MRWRNFLFAVLISTTVYGAQRNTTALAPDDVAVVIIPIRAFQYNGGIPVTVKVGQRVVWANQDKMQHTASGDAGEFDTGILQPGATSEPVTFLQETGADGLTYHCNVHDGMSGKVIVQGKVPTDPAAHHETPSIHSMVVMGTSALFLSHIALFNDDNHAYQVTLEGQLDDAAAQTAYAQYRRDHPDEFCQLDPENFLLPEIQSSRSSFRGTFKRDGDDAMVVPGLRDVKVNIVRVIQFSAFDSRATYPDRLTYQLFGNTTEVFLTNQITEAPNFQEVLKIRGVPVFLTAQQIGASPIITIPSKQLRRSETKALKTATFGNTSHLVLSPPPATLNPKEPLSSGEEVEVLVTGDPTPHKLTVENSIFFDVRILNK